MKTTDLNLLLNKSNQTYMNLLVEPTKANSYKSVNLLGMFAVRAISKINEIDENYSILNRKMRKAKKVFEDVPCVIPTTITITITNPYADCHEKLIIILTEIGKQMHYALELWQASGASFEDLCNLCNVNADNVKTQLGKSYDKDISFIDLIFVHNIDFKENCDFLYDTPSAPFNTCSRYYLLDEMRTKINRKEIRQVYDTLFPEAN